MTFKSFEIYNFPHFKIWLNITQSRMVWRPLSHVRSLSRVRPFARPYKSVQRHVVRMNVRITDRTTPNVLLHLNVKVIDNKKTYEKESAIFKVWSYIKKMLLFFILFFSSKSRHDQDVSERVGTFPIHTRLIERVGERIVQPYLKYDIRFETCELNFTPTVIQYGFDSTLSRRLL